MLRKALALSPDLARTGRTEPDTPCDAVLNLWIGYASGARQYRTTALTGKGSSGQLEAPSRSVDTSFADIAVA